MKRILHIRAAGAAGAAFRVVVASILIAAFLFFGLPGEAHSTQPGQRSSRTLVLISLDGFRWDYLERGVSPNINALAARGVRAKYMIPVFPSETFPNHYSIVTGVYPEEHGIVKNNMYDPVFNASFSMSLASDSRWWGAEPVWITAVKQDQKSAVFFWPGSEAEVEGARPTYWKKYDEQVPNSTRIEQVFTWLEMPAGKRPSFIGVYFSDVDHAGHEYGPDSQQVLSAIKTVDKSVGHLVAGLSKRHLTDNVDIIIVSDHGMATTHPQQRVYVSDYVQAELLQSGRQFLGTNGMLWPMPGKEEQVYEAFRKAAHLRVYRKNETPAYFHYRNNRRIAPIVFVADEGWIVEYGRTNSANQHQTGGAHGYDPRLPDMHAIFVAAGPNFKSGTVIDPFENIQIYGLICRILRLRPAKNDGDPSWCNNLLR